MPRADKPQRLAQGGGSAIRPDNFSRTPEDEMHLYAHLVSLRTDLGPYLDWEDGAGQRGTAKGPRPSLSNTVAGH